MKINFSTSHNFMIGKEKIIAYELDGFLCDNDLLIDMLLGIHEDT